MKNRAFKPAPKRLRIPVFAAAMLALCVFLASCTAGPEGNTGSPQAQPEPFEGLTVNSGDAQIHALETDEYLLVLAMSGKVPFIHCSDDRRLELELPYEPSSLTVRYWPSVYLGRVADFTDQFEYYLEPDGMSVTLPESDPGKGGPFDYIVKVDTAWTGSEGAKRSASYGFWASSVLSDKRLMTIQDLKELSAKAGTISWADMEEFIYATPYSGRYVRVYKVDDIYEFNAEGDPSDSPVYMKLRLRDHPEMRLGIENGADVDAFVKSCEEILSLSEPEQSIAFMRVKYPMFFDLDTSDGLTVMVASPAEGKYACYFAAGNVDTIRYDQTARPPSAGPKEVKIILQNYADVPADKIIIRPFYDPSSERKLEPSSYEKELREFFENKYTIGSAVKMVSP